MAHKKNTNGIHWEVSDDISNAISEDMWDNKVAYNSCVNSYDFIKAIEKLPDNHFNYFIARDHEHNIVAFALVNILEYDVTLMFPTALHKMVGKIRSLFPKFLYVNLAMTGSLESHYKCFWFNKDVWSLVIFVESLTNAIRSTFNSFKRSIVIRDFFTDLYNEEKKKLQNNKIKNMMMLDTVTVARLTLSPFNSREEYIRSLPKNCRYYLKKAIKKRETEGLSVNIIEDYLPIIKSLYSMYLAVNKRAKEFKSNPLPIEFFEYIKNEFGSRSKLLTIHKKGNIIAYTLILEANNVINMYLAGTNDNINKKYDIIYNLILETISIAIRDRILAIELGTTNYFVKKRFGAEFQNMMALVQGKNFFVNLLLKLATLCGAK